MSNPHDPPPDPNDPRWQNPQPHQPYGPGFQNAPYYRPGYTRPSNASTILVLGIVSLVVCAPLGISAWIMGKTTLSQMDQGVMDNRERGMAHAGMICGIVATCLMIVGCFVYGMAFLLALGGGFR